MYALINLSPNIAINDPAAFLLNNPWGLYIARAVMGGKLQGHRRKRPLKVATPVPNAGAHVIGSSMTSADITGVYKEIERFAVDKLGLAEHKQGVRAVSSP